MSTAPSPDHVMGPRVGSPTKAATHPRVRKRGTEVALKQMEGMGAKAPVGISDHTP
jgi:hypothetical protein